MNEDLRPTFHQRLPEYHLRGRGGRERKKTPPNMFLIPQHYHPLQHTSREKKKKKIRVHFLQYNLAHTKRLHKFSKVTEFLSSSEA